MIGEDFIYNGKQLSDFGMELFDPEDDQEFVEMEVISSENQTRDIKTHFSTNYNSTLTIPFLILKNDSVCSTQTERELTGDNINEICSWLQGVRTPSEFKLTNQPDIIYYGNFTHIQPYIVAKKCYGLYLTFTCNAPYGFSPYITTTYNLTSDNIDLTFDNISANKNEYLKPIIEIISNNNFQGTETINIKNITDSNNCMNFSIPEGIQKLIIDCGLETITNENNNIVSLSDIGINLPISDTYNFVSANQYFFYWLRFLPGNNNLNITSTNMTNVATVNIKVQYPKKAGGF